MIAEQFAAADGRRQPASRTLLAIQAAAAAEQNVSHMDRLPEFRVVLSRVQRSAKAEPIVGRRTKFGGDPDWEQGIQDNPPCPRCKRPMTFVAQIDSIEHNSIGNPCGVDWRTGNQKWMFGDVGMIYVFFCFECLEPHAAFECG